MGNAAPTRADWLVGAALGIASALLTAAAAGGGQLGLLVSYFAPLPLFAAGLAHGVSVAAGAAIAGIASLLAFGQLPLAAIYTVIWAGPTLWLLRLALLSRAPSAEADPAASGRDWFPEDRLLLWLSGIAAAFVVVTMMLLAARPEGWQAFLGELHTIAMRDFGAALREGGLADQEAALSQLMRTIIWLAPGMIATSWMVLMFVNGALAIRLLRLMGRMVRPPLQLQALRMPPWVALGFGLFLAAALLSQGPAGFLGSNLALVFAIPPFLVGLAVIHAALGPRPGGGMMLLAFYLMLAVLGFPALIALALGLADPWADFRQRASGSS